MLEAILPLHFDATMRSCFCQCPEKFRKEFVWGLRPPGISIDLHAGGCFATGLEHVYSAFHKDRLPLEDALMKASTAYEVAWGEVVSAKPTAKTRERVWEGVIDYFDRYPPLTDHVQPFFRPDGSPTTEFSFAIPLEPCVPPRGLYDPGSYSTAFPEHPSGAPFTYAGRFDMLGQYNGRRLPKDEKTSGTSAGSGWAEKWDLRGQFIGYVWALQQMGYTDVDSVCVRGVGILKTKFDHAELIKPYSNHLIGKWHEQLRRDLWRLRRMWDEGYFDYNFGESCTAYGNCVFQTMCASPNPESWAETFEVRRWNPVLKNPISEAA